MSCFGSFFVTTRLFSFIDHTRGDLDGFDFLLWCFFAFDKSAFFAHLHLNRAGFSAEVGFLDDFRRLLSRQRDLCLWFQGTMHFAQVVKKHGFVLIREDIVRHDLVHTRRFQLLKQH